jgi:hypothetical protein
LYAHGGWQGGNRAGRGEYAGRPETLLAPASAEQAPIKALGVVSPSS